MNRDGFMCKSVKKILDNNKHDIEILLGGSTRIIIADRRNSNNASMLFSKYSFSKSFVPIGSSQKCNGRNGCMCCGMMNIKRSVLLWDDHPAYRTNVRLDFRCTCITENVVYLYICKLHESNNSYFMWDGRVNSARIG